MDRLGIRLALAAGLCLFLLAAWWTQTAQVVVGQPPVPPPPGASNPQPVQPDSNPEVLTRGPIHEAYAIPVNTGRKTGLVVPRQPPNPIEEIPPEAKPEGEVVWIPGYFSWDDDRKGFVWVSGVWRAPPPNYHWIPGYWNQVQHGYQWVSGFWQPVALQEVEYLPQPPDTLDQGPTSPAPAEDYVWISGCWRWSETRYAWQPGYWAPINPQWVWIPANYYWCPRGWVYCGGYWDYPLSRRGLMFAPVYFAGPVAYFRPVITVDVGFLTFSLFVRPHYCHYYFGDYYAAEYEGLGIYPWFSFASSHHGYDPLFSYYRWYYHDHYHDLAWEKNLHGWYDYYRGHPTMRPPHTWAAQQRLLGEPGMRDRPGLTIGVSLRDIAANPHASVRLETVSAHQAELIRQSIHQERDFHAERRQLEASGGRRLPGGPVAPERISLSKLPSYNAMHGQQHDFRAVQSPQHVSRPVVGNPSGRFQTQPSAGAFRQPSYEGSQGRPSAPGSGGSREQKDKRDDRKTKSAQPGGLPNIAMSGPQPREARRVITPPAAPAGQPSAPSGRGKQPSPAATFRQPAAAAAPPQRGLDRKDRGEK
jgi:hypothetical protein